MYKNISVKHIKIFFNNNFKINYINNIIYIFYKNGFKKFFNKYQLLQKIF